MYKFPFSLPPFYIAIIRCLGILEGLSIEIDKDFRIINDAYPYIASRLLTDPSVELQLALQQLLFKDGEPRWDRLQELLEKAATTNDYDASSAIDQLLTYLFSDQAKNIREILIQQIVINVDQLGSDSVDYSIKVVSNLLSPNGPGLSLLQQRDLNNFFDALRESILASATPSPTLLNAEKIIRIFQSSSKNFIDSERLTSIARKILREPVARETLAIILSQLSERAASRIVKRIFGS
jgi:aarF domain-containing kinase